MAYNVAKDISDMLVTGGIGTFAAASGWGIYISKEPLTPNTVVTVYHTGGAEPNAKWRLDFPTVQIRVRGDVNGYVAAHDKARAIFDLLLGKSPTTVNTNLYSGFWCMNDIIFLKYDDNNRPLFVINFRLAVEPSSGTNRSAL